MSRHGTNNTQTTIVFFYLLIPAKCVQYKECIALIMVIVNCNVCAHPIYGKWTMQSHMLEFGKSNLRWPRKCNETRWREYWKSKKLREMGICRDKRPSLAHNTHTFLGVQCVFMALNHLPPPHAGHNVHFICTIWSFFYVFDFFFLLCVVCWLVPAVRHCWRCTASFVFYGIGDAVISLNHFAGP